MIIRPRRLRENPLLRDMVKEYSFTVSDLVYPLFVTEGTGVKNEIPTMPGVYHFSIDKLIEEIAELIKLKIKAVILFGVPNEKSDSGFGAYDENGIIQRAVRSIKNAKMNILVITDVCLCEYTSHGHCGVVEGQKILNDPSADLIAKTALSHAVAGADMVAPSDMMDGRVGKIRTILDEHGFYSIPIMSYSAKYASSFYAPFRDAADSAPMFGDRKSYQMDYSNSREALKEIKLDTYEGADIVMVKPAMAYLDIVANAKRLIDVPIAVYNVSGEYAMVKSAAKSGTIDEMSVVCELMTSFKRAGADIIITYHAKDIAKYFMEGNCE